jgi:Ca-activated chloride channel family protein
MGKPINYYDILGLAPDADHEEIVAEAEKLSARFPEHLRDPENNVAFRQLLKAYEVLGSPEKRAKYDRQLAELQSPLNINLQTSRRTIGAINSAQLLYVLAELHPTLLPVKERPMPINICLVIDRSTSMQGARLDRVKSAAKLIIQQLSQKDIISVISFSDRAEIISPAGHVYNRAQLTNRIDGISPSGGTEIYQGLKAGLAEMRNVDLHRYLNKLVLLTDGHTYGDEEQCLKLAQEAIGQDIIFSALGIGTDWNDQFLDQIAAISGGQSMYIEAPDQIITGLQNEIEGLGAVYAHNTKLSVNTPPGIRLNYTMKISPFAQPLSFFQNQIRLGTIAGRSPLMLLMELTIEPQKPGSKLIIPLTIMADIPSRQIHQQSFQRQIEVSVVEHEPQFVPPPTIIRAVQMLNFYRMNERVWDDVKGGQLDKATQRMRRLSTRLMESGQPSLAYDALVETQRIARMGTLSAEGRKRLKYGTRSLLTGTISADKKYEV